MDLLDPSGEGTHILSEIEEHEGGFEGYAGSGDSFFSGRYNFSILLAFLVAFFNQVSGINFVIYYAPRIFESAGLASSTALLSSVGIGLVNLVFTMLGIYLIDRAGRKQLMLCRTRTY